MTEYYEVFSEELAGVVEKLQWQYENQKKEGTL